MRIAIHIVCVLLVAACTEPPPPAAVEETAEPPKPEPAPEPPRAAPIVVRDGLKQPESVLYDAAADVYLVANIQGKPLEKDRNGFISRVGPDGKMLELKWITAKLNAPKGMAISGGKLYVADIDTLRIFDATTGKPSGSVKIKGSTFLNDVTAAPDGTIYVSDTGLMQWGPYMEPNGKDAIYRIDGKQAVPVIEGKELGNPNGILADATGLWVVNKVGELCRVSLDGKRGPPEKAPKGSLDGIIQTSKGLLISSWEGKAVYLRAEDGSFTKVVEKLTSPADIGYDSKRNRVLVPLLTRGEFHIVPL